jgi:hypothetical protein
MCSQMTNSRQERIPFVFLVVGKTERKSTGQVRSEREQDAIAGRGASSCNFGGRIARNGRIAPGKRESFHHVLVLNMSREEKTKKKKKRNERRMREQESFVETCLL